MKIKYTYPSIFQSDPSELQKYSSSLAMLALTPDKNIEVVQELYHPSVWKSFWSQVQSKDLDKININKKFNEDPDNVSWLFKQLVNGLEYIISNGYIFFGLLHYSPRPFGSQIHEERGLFKKKSKFFDDMISKYHDVEIYPTLDKTNCCIEAQFIGTGEKFVRYTDTLENLSMQQIAQMTAYFRGSLTGIFGMNTLPKNMFQFIILSQNLTKESIISPLIFDRNGKNTLERLIKNKKFSPAGGFKLDYGIWGLSNIPQWNTLELLPKFSKHITKYNKYLQAIMANKLSPFPSQIHSDPFGFNFIDACFYSIIIHFTSLNSMRINSR